MVTTTNKIYEDIKTYITQKGEPLGKWYVGSTSDVYQCLFVEHRVSEQQDLWIYKQCTSTQSAKNVKMTLMKLGCEGRTGGWDESNVVYAYLKTPDTIP
jgi:hypothetical protein